VIVSFLVNMLFLKIKSGLFIIRLFFPTDGGGPAVPERDAAAADGVGIECAWWGCAAAGRRGSSVRWRVGIHEKKEWGRTK
jgi:hypothetical protein